MRVCKFCGNVGSLQRGAEGGWFSGDFRALESPREPCPACTLVGLVANLTLAENLGDVRDDIIFVAEREGIELSGEPEDWPRDFGRLGIKTIYGADLYEDEEDDHAESDS